MENLRIKSLEGGESLIRSFPSKVSVRQRCFSCKHMYTHNCTKTRTHIALRAASSTRTARLLTRRYCRRINVNRCFFEIRTLDQFTCAMVASSDTRQKSPPKGWRVPNGCRPSPISSQSSSRNSRMNFQFDPTRLSLNHVANRPLVYQQPAPAYAPPVRSPPIATSGYKEKARFVGGVPLVLLLVGACCLLSAIVVTVAIYIIASEMSRTRDDVRPLINAALPLMSDSSRITGVALQASERMLTMVERASNATMQVLPIAQRLYDAINQTAETLAHVEHITRHPTMHITMDS